MEDDQQSEHSLPPNSAEKEIEIEEAVNDEETENKHDHQDETEPSEPTAPDAGDETDVQSADPERFITFRKQPDAAEAKFTSTDEQLTDAAGPPASDDEEFGDNRLRPSEQSLLHSLYQLRQTIEANTQVRDTRNIGLQASQSASPVTVRYVPDSALLHHMIEEKVNTMDSSYSPKPFKGQVGEDVESFIQEFDKYTEYRDLNERKSLNLLKVLLKEGAGEWLGRLDGHSKDNVRALKEALLERYGRSKIIKHKTARELFARKQGPEEDVETFISACVKLSTSFESQAEAMAMYAIMGGLRPHLAAFVAQKQPQNLKELIEYTRLADMTVSPVNDQPMLQQMTEMKTELQRLGSKLEKATTAQVRSPSPSKDRRVRFDSSPQRERSTTNYDRPRGGRAGGFNQGRSQWNNHNSQQSQSAGNQPTQDCSRCGRRGGHDHPNRCRAINLNCRYCGKLGHFAMCCFKARRDRQTMNQNQNPQ